MARFKLIPKAHLLLFKEGNILLLHRYNTGYEDGSYSVIAGHIDGGETARSAMAREAKEEAGIHIEPESLMLAHVIHRRGVDERVSFFFTTKEWRGEPQNREPEKCSELGWFARDALPMNVIPYVRHAIAEAARERLYSEFGWASET